MDYYIDDKKIIIPNPTDFNIKHICECGQMFRFSDKTSHFEVMSTKFSAIVYENDKKSVIIESENEKYFEKYFDLNNDYAIIKSELITTSILKQAINFGYGIRIVKQDLLETIISFIISANNNIGRIKKIINELCTCYGEKVENHFAFPTLNALKSIKAEEFVKMGAGYRANYLVDTINLIDEKFLADLKIMDTKTAYEQLVKLKGVGNKVAECILLFGLSKTDVFPVDVWMSRVCKEYFGLQCNRKNMSQSMVKKFGSLAGYAHQYLFYYKRTKEI